MKGSGLLENLLNWLANTQPTRYESLLHLTQRTRWRFSAEQRYVLKWDVFSSQRRSFLHTIIDDEYVFRMWEISVIYCTAKHFTANRWSTGIPRRKLLKSLTLAKPWLIRSKSNDKWGIRTTFSVDMTATTGSCLLTHNIYLLITRQVMPTKCHKRLHSTGTLRGPVLRLSNKCEPDLPKSHLPYIFPAFTVAGLIPELRWKL